MAEKECTGIQYDDRNEQETVLDQLRKEADGGSVHAMEQLGKMYIEGDGVPQSNEEAAEWFYQAASLGSMLGQLMMGKLHLDGTGVSKNVDLAWENLEKATAQGNVEARELLDRLTSELNASNQNSRIPVVKSQEEGTTAKRAAQDTWKEKDISRREVAIRLREGVQKLMKIGEKEQQERLIIVPSVVNIGKTKKWSPGIFKIICFIISAFFSTAGWLEIFIMGSEKERGVFGVLVSIIFETIADISFFSILTCVIVFILPILCVGTLTKWIIALLNRGKVIEEETKRLNEARDEALKQKNLLNSEISLIEKSVRETLSFLPERYHNIDSCVALAQIVEDKRADTLKEALNIYSLENSGGVIQKNQKISRRGLY